MRKEDKVKWFGLWHSYMGLWQGIAKENDFGDLNKDFIPFGKNLGPGKSQEGSKRFYDAFIGSVADYGFDFVKIDNQSLYNSKQKNVDSSVQINTWMTEALENAIEEADAGGDDQLHEPRDTPGVRDSSLGGGAGEH